MNTAATVLDTLKHWTDAGWLRQLDSALPRFLHTLDPTAPPLLLWASALLSHMEGRGHTCVALDTLCQPHHPRMDWPPEARAALAEVWAGLPADRASWAKALGSSPWVRVLWPEPAAEQGQPLLLGGSAAHPLLYLRRYWAAEQAIAEALQQRLQTDTEALPAPDSVHTWLRHLFTAAPDQDPDWQRIAATVALRRRLTLITGGPGTGKTYTAARLLTLLWATSPRPEQLRVALAAPTGKAAARLSQSIAQALARLSPHGLPLDLGLLHQRLGKARTLHALLGAQPHRHRFKYHAARPLDVDVLIVDETSMVHLEMMAGLLAALPPHAKLVLLGDKDQLASVEAGSVLGDLCVHAEAGHCDQDTVAHVQEYAEIALPRRWHWNQAGPAPALAQQTVMLRHSHRFAGNIGAFAQAVNRGDLSHYVPQTQSDSTVAGWPQALKIDWADLVRDGRAGAPVGYRAYLALLPDRPARGSLADHEAWVRQVLQAFERFRVLCAVHDGEQGDRALNQGIQQTLQHAKLLPVQGEWFVGRPVMVTRNDPALGVFNGDVGVVLPAHHSPSLRAYFLDGDTVRSVAVSRLAHVETAFAMTVHKSQGSEFEHTVLVLPRELSPVLTRQLVYTGITRARQHFTLIEGQAGVLEAAVRNVATRASGLRLALESPTPFSPLDPLPPC